MLKFGGVLVIVFLLLVGLFSLPQTPTPKTVILTPTPTPTPTPTTAPTPIPLDISVFNNDVPFTVQAPLGEWGDPKQQDACEEAAILMGVKWARNETIDSPQQAKDEIIKIADYQIEKYGDSRDTSSLDSVERIAKGYFNFQKVDFKENITAMDIIRELQNGNLVITPMNGQAMNNPHFTAPGPERHMVLIIGYDLNSKEFITNDAGIAPGKDYRYPIDVFYNAIRDYQTGYHIPIEGELKNMIVIRR